MVYACHCLWTLGLSHIFKQASACQPPTREICCIGPGIVDGVEQDLYITFTYQYRYILRAWIFFFLRDVDPAFPTTPPGPQFLQKFGPDFRDTGPEIEPRFPAKPLRRKSIWAARGGNRTCDLSVASLCAPNYLASLEPKIL